MKNLINIASLRLKLKNKIYTGTYLTSLEDLKNTFLIQLLKLTKRFNVE